MKKIKTFGVSPGTDKKELALAKLIAGAKGAGMGFCTGAAWRNSDGVACLPHESPVQCCALGAERLWCEKEEEPSDLIGGTVIQGNDRKQDDWYYPADTADDDDDEDVGYAFRQAMTDE